MHRDGRVTKAEPNPDHPVNRGGLCARGQSAVQGLYDPDRLKTVARMAGLGSFPSPLVGEGRVRGALSAGESSPSPGLRPPSPTRGEGEAPAAAPDIWATAFEGIGKRLKAAGSKVAVITDLQTGAMAEVIDAFIAAFGSKRLLVYEPFSYEPLRAAHEAVFGLPVIPDYRLDACEFVLSFGADFLESWVSNVRYAEQFGRMHAYRDGKAGRFAYVGPRMSMTAANADDFLQVPPGGELVVAMAMLGVIVDQGLASADVASLKPLLAAWRATNPALPAGVSAERVEALTKMFAAKAPSVALACPVGASGPPARDTAIAAALLNYAAGRIGRTVDFSRPHALGRAATSAETQKFLGELGPQDVLIILNANPAYSVPGAAEQVAKAGTVVYLGTMPDETAALATWVLPIDSPLESWGDHEPLAGVHSLMQPTMSRLWDTRSAGDVLMGMASAAGKTLARLGAGGQEPYAVGLLTPSRGSPAIERGQEPNKQGLQTPSPRGGFEAWLHVRWDELRTRLAPAAKTEDFWRDALRRGGVWEEPPAAKVELSAKAAGLVLAPPAAPAPDKATVDLWPWASVFLFDGRVANRAWLQESPDPMSTIVWTNWVDIHSQTAGGLDLKDNDVVCLFTLPAGKIEAAVRVTDDVAPGVAAISFGQGHAALGRTAAHHGANAFRLLPPGQAEGVFARATIRKTARRYELVHISASEDQWHREIVQWAPLSKVRTMKPGEGDKLILPLPEGYRAGKDVYPAHEYKEHRWAMAVDLDRCIGCGACTVACYAENNVTTVGEFHVGKFRGMAWIKAVPYRKEDDARRAAWLVLMCQHCDAAPCEPVCPVFASVHTDEGLNAQVFNRCIGTRYCSHNCPYKVRRFNWLNTEREKPLDWQLNPEVTVRSRGVMEKCTFCIQRIRQAEYRAKREGRKVRDGEVVPACVATCPTRVFTFGDLLDPASKVTEVTRRDPRRYHLLEEQNTKPGVTYLRRIERLL